jgi:hypothetical protein
MRFVDDDGGRKTAGFKGSTGDCVTRAITIATGKPYREVYDALHQHTRDYAANHRDRTASLITRGGASPRDGVAKKVYRPYLQSLGWMWVPTMQIGSGCKVHLRADELPKGNIIVSVSKHLCAVIDGVIHDTHDPSCRGKRCVYGYYVKSS